MLFRPLAAAALAAAVLAAPTAAAEDPLAPLRDFVGDTLGIDWRDLRPSLPRLPDGGELNGTLPDAPAGLPLGPKLPGLPLGGQDPDGAPAPEKRLKPRFYGPPAGDEAPGGGDASPAPPAAPAPPPPSPAPKADPGAADPVLPKSVTMLRSARDSAEAQPAGAPNRVGGDGGPRTALPVDGPVRDAEEADPAPASRLVTVAKAPAALQAALWIGAAAALALASALPPMRRLARRVGLLALLTRVPRDKVLEQPTRARIYQEILENPGIHANALCRRLSISKSHRDHHVWALVQAGHVVRRRAGGYICLFASRHAGLAATRHAHLVRAPLAWALMREVCANPGCRAVSVEASLGGANGTLAYHIRRLSAAGLLRVERDGRRRTLWPTCEGYQALESLGGPSMEPRAPSASYTGPESATPVPVTVCPSLKPSPVG